MSIEEVRSLVAERQRYDDWLSALDARKVETPERVFVRVRGDYDARRSDVLTKLAEHVAELEMLSGALQQQGTELTSRLDALEEQRVEAMIRNAVGEYDNDKWESLRGDVEGQITRLTDDRALVQMELDEIHALLDQARPTTPTGPSGAEPVAQPIAEPVSGTADAAPVSSVEPEANTSDSPAAADERVDISADTVEMEVFSISDEAMALGESPVTPTLVAPSAGNDSLPDVVTIAEGVSVVEESSFTAPESAAPFGTNDVDDALSMFAETPAHPMPAVPSAPSAPAPTVPPIDPFDDLAFLHSVIAPSGSQPAVPAAAMPAATVTPPSVPVAANPAEQAKTLRCTECGTMNLPTEWYCERCGGELAAF